MKIKGTNKADTLTGSSGDDVILGKKGGDVLYGGAGDDLVKGGRGSDVLYGGSGENTLKGGKGADLFVISENEFDNIVDFQPGKDKVMIISPDGPSGPPPFDGVGYDGANLSYHGTDIATVGGLDIAHDLLIA